MVVVLLHAPPDTSTNPRQSRSHGARDRVLRPTAALSLENAAAIKR
jgi:hypothetical protein